MGRRISIPIVLIGVVGLAVLVLVRAPASTTGDARNRGATIDPAHGDLGGTTRPDGGIPRRPVDPASPAYEGRNTDDWDALHASERVQRVERAVMAALVEGADVERAWMVLSAARADFFGSDTGAQRYVELEQALLDTMPVVR